MEGRRQGGARNPGGSVSESESFIDEVTEEVRRDQLFAFMRRYGWIAILAVVLVVGWAGWTEWSKAQVEAAAQTRGDAILAALNANAPADRATALAPLAKGGDAGAIAALLEAANFHDAGDNEKAAATLDTVVADMTVSPIYRDLAALKAVMLRGDSMDPAARKAALQPLVTPGAPYRLLAQEQMALADLDAGDTAAALKGFQDIVQDAEVTRGLRDRAQGMIVALGGTPTADAAAAAAAAALAAGTAAASSN